MSETRHRLYRAGIWAVTAPLPRQRRVSLRHRLRGGLDNRLALNADCIVLSRAKSGRTWLRVLLSRLFQKRHGLDEHALLEYDNFHRRNSAIPVVAMTHGHYLDRLAGHPRKGPKLRAKPVVFLVRDPRDVAVSEYFQSTRRASAYKRELYGVDDNCSMFDFVMESSVGLKPIVEYLNHWHQTLADWPRVHRLRYEDLRAEPERRLGELCEFLGQDFSPEAIAEAVQFASFEKLKAREKENYFRNNRLAAKNPDDPDSFKVRRGKVGGFRDYFSDSELAAMEDYVSRNLEPGLGYRD